MFDDRIQFWDTTLNGGAGAFRPALNSDPFRFFTTSELNSTVIGAKGSRAGLGDPSYTQVGAGPQLVNDAEEYFANRASSGDTDPFFAYLPLHSPHRPWAVTEPFRGLRLKTTALEKTPLLFLPQTMAPRLTWCERVLNLEATPILF